MAPEFLVTFATVSVSICRFLYHGTVCYFYCIHVQYTVIGTWTNMFVLLQGRVVGARRGRRKRTENGSNIMLGRPSLGPLYGTRHSLTIPISRYVLSSFSNDYFLRADRHYSTVMTLPKCQEMDFAVVSKSQTCFDVSNL